MGNSTGQRNEMTFNTIWLHVVLHKSIFQFILVTFRSLDGNNLTAIPFSPAQLKDLVYLSLYVAITVIVIEFCDQLSGN